MAYNQHEGKYLRNINARFILLLSGRPDTALVYPLSHNCVLVLVAIPAERRSAGIRSSVMQPAGSQWWPLALPGLQVCRTDG